MWSIKHANQVDVAPSGIDRLRTVSAFGFGGQSCVLVLRAA
jgi:hypothetical protein